MATTIERNPPFDRAAWFPLLLVVLSACTPSERPAQATTGLGGPSEHDFMTAMESAAPMRAIADGECCQRVRELQCRPMHHGETFQCTYRYERDRTGTAMLEREERGFWRWVSGPRNCTARGRY